MTSQKPGQIVSEFGGSLIWKRLKSFYIVAKYSWLVPDFRRVEQQDISRWRFLLKATGAAVVAGSDDWQ